MEAAPPRAARPRPGHSAHADPGQQWRIWCCLLVLAVAGGDPRHWKSPGLHHHAGLVSPPRRRRGAPALEATTTPPPGAHRGERPPPLRSPRGYRGARCPSLRRRRGARYLAAAAVKSPRTRKEEGEREGESEVEKRERCGAARWLRG
ncbi:hypothetical protein PVAP13_8KG171301 [Panicum virgatum]|uniref:Uncharacterized protein n=1 Tax=Panicum virgatum TaxID=38727 RepID=A0A8T0PHN5_PANVG|nr:hypothetical protein PVAP13_8KG171301 [Panicum virgatum]